MNSETSLPQTAQNPSDIKSDIQSEKNLLLQSLDWVGMGDIQSAILYGDLSIPTSLSMMVSLKEGQRGIHMSRLYSLMMEKYLNKCHTFKSLDDLLLQMIDSQNGLSTSAGIMFSFKAPVQTQALKSEKLGFRVYDVAVRAVKIKDQNVRFWLSIDVLYSSTCPQSAALSVEIFNNLHAKNKNNVLDRLPATPHAQRSVMNCELLFELMPKDFLNDTASLELKSVIEKYIQVVESTLKTPVQTAVKKADEMQFAVLNSENLMFCEDAVRKVDQALKSTKNEFLSGHKVSTRHEESLHPHNAISSISYNYMLSPL
ncbi:MAG: GTP cyclohydrolase FolE2 [Pseudobdellovibrio sp.]